MPESFEIDPQRELVICRVWGILTDAEVRSHYKRMVADPAFRPDYRQLADLRDVTEFSVESKTIEDAARQQIFAPGTRRAFVAPRGVAFGLARMFALYSAAADQVTEVFAEARSAEDWLGVTGVLP
ncbi:MAG: hypothetical protein ABIT20_22095 [Gemmatimonadaceae bacterium]